VIILGANISGKPNVSIGLSDSLVSDQGLDAVMLIKTHVAGLIKGGGGGQKVLATAGGQDATGLQKTIDAVKAFIKSANF
jgi:alanyl-tRNA synthetase